MNIAIIEAFLALKEYAHTFQELAAKIEAIELKNNKQFADIYEALKYLAEDKQNRDDWKSRQKIGF